MAAADPNNWRGVRLTGAVDSAQVRLDTLLGADYVVAPIVLLVADSVIFPVNAESPEFVPGRVLSVAPAGWNGRPAMAGDHPSMDGVMVSANSPSVIEQHSFGQLFATRYEDGRLRSEVWIDPRRAAVVEDGIEILQRIKDGDPVEISVGAFVMLDNTAGTTPGGAQYGAMWDQLVPDHVALLRRGLIGACSIAMGCGTPRMATRHHVLEAAGLRVMTEQEVLAAAADILDPIEPVAAATEAPVTTDDKLIAMFGSVAALATLAAADMSDDDLRELLGEALKRTETQFVGIRSVTPGTSTVVYLVDPDPGGPAPLRPYQRTYVLGENNRVTFNDDRIAVRPRTEWVPIAATQTTETPAAAAAGGCSCGGHKRTAASATGAEGETMPVNAERILALIASERTPWSEADRAYLEGMTEARIVELEQQAAPPAEPTAEEIAAAAAAEAATRVATQQPGTVQIAETELQELRTLANERKVDRAARKKVFVGQLLTAQSHHKEPALQAMELEQLQDLAGVLNLGAQSTDVDFIAASRTNDTTEEASAPPKPYTLALAKGRATA